MSQSLEFPQGYYRFPALHKNTVVFVSEDDLWKTTLDGGPATRLTSGLGQCSYPAISEDGLQIAFIGRDEGEPEVFVMPVQGGSPKRITYLGATDTRILGWQNNEIVFTTNARQAFAKFLEPHTIKPGEAYPKSLNIGHGMSISFHKKIIALGRNSGDAARWKRYRGGTAGEIWVDTSGNGKYELVSRKFGVKGNFVSPVLIEHNNNTRLYFVSDHDGIANIYSTTLKGTDLKQHTFHTDFYVRHPKKDSSGLNKLVYHAGGDLYVLDCQTDETHKLNFDYLSPKTQLNQKFVPAAKYLETYEPHPYKNELVINARGKTYITGFKSSPVMQLGLSAKPRYRMATYLSDGEHLCMVSDESGVEKIEVYSLQNEKIWDSGSVDLGIVQAIYPSPKNKKILVATNRNKLHCFDIESSVHAIVAENDFASITQCCWSPDSRYIAFINAISNDQHEISILDTKTNATHTVTKAVLSDFSPSFDPTGRYLFFLSRRIFDPVYDNLHFDLNFPYGVKPYLITLQKDLVSPFFSEAASRKKPNGSKKKPEEKEIDFDGIQDRILAVPVAEKRYFGLVAGKDKLYLAHRPIKGALSSPKSPFKKDAILESFNLQTQKTDVITRSLTSFTLSGDGGVLVYRSGNQLHYSPVESNSFEEIPLNKVSVNVQPREEWKQMAQEAWRLQLEHFWREDMAGTDWEGMFERYAPLLDRLGSRAEFSDFMWELQGELGTSHCYEYGGDYRPSPAYIIGQLGASFSYHKKKQAYQIQSMPEGDPWDSRSPLKSPGCNLKTGDLIYGINGQQVSSAKPLEAHLMNFAGKEIMLKTGTLKSKQKRDVRLKTLGNDRPLYYRHWVNQNLAYVHKVSKGKVGYVHIPNMGPDGYAEFFRLYLREYVRQGLIVDVRYNGGGHVSQLILEKLARKRLGYDVQRWSTQPDPYPSYSVSGPIVGLTNEYAGSDGDIFSHSFKMLGIGKLVGKRTWGGVIGINPKYRLADGTTTTQPEYSFWFNDVAWNVENYGADPDIYVEIAPQDYAKTKDPQLDKALKEVMDKLKGHKPKFPTLEY
jgi:tricorn protease